MKMRNVNQRNKRRIQEFQTQNLPAGLLKTAICLIICAVFFTGGIHVNADVKRGAATGAAVGGLLGLVFGDDLGDALGGAAIGAGVGAAGGAVSSSMKKKEAEKKAQQQQAAKAQQAADQEQQQEQALIHAIGEDNYRGLVALVDCEHTRAEGLAEAGAASNDPNHRLASLWLKALIANDLKQTERTAELYQQLIAADKDIDTEQQASIETDKVLMDVREERRANGITCQP